jgi:N-acetylated-alpha-linked acidic dipeptidase
MRRSILVLLVNALLLHSAIADSPNPANDGPLDGFSSDNARTERDWEQKFRAIPNPKKQHDYMQLLSARPHHVGSGYDKQNAEWILARFKEWGLDTHIETFHVLFPTPKRRVPEMTEPRHYVASFRSL